MLPHSIDFEAIGTKWRIESLVPLLQTTLQRIYQRIETFDATYSRFRADSQVSEISRKAGGYIFPDDIVPLMDVYQKLYERTGGKVTPLIGNALERAGYDAEYSFVEREQKVLPSLDSVLKLDGTTIRTNQPVVLDFGAAGKGYLIDIVATILDEEGVTEYVIDGSGDMRHRGTAINRVGLEHPLRNDVVVGAIDVQNASLCASAPNRRAWGRGMHHIFDPTTLRPTNDILATWVIAQEALHADGLATALFFVDPKKLENDFSFQYVRMFKDASLEYSHNFTGEIF